MGPAPPSCFQAYTDPYGDATADPNTTTPCTPPPPHTNTAYDQGLSGLAAAWYPDSSTPSGTIALHTFLPGGSFNFTSDSPGTGVPAGEPFSATITGWVVPSTVVGPLIVETYGGEVDSLSVNGQLGTGIPTGGSTSGCPVYPGFTGSLGNGPAQISITWSSTGAPPSFGIFSETNQELNVSTGCGEPVLSPIPVGFLPGYNLVTSTQTDNAGTGTSNALTDYAYANPANGLRTQQVVDPNGQDLVTNYAYEGASGLFDLSSTTLPAGNSTTDTYFNGTDAALTATNPCPGGASGINQGDGLYQQTTPAQTETYIYNSAGQVLASRAASADGWTCATYDGRGRPTSVAYPAFGASPAYTDSYNYEVGNDPLVAAVTKAVSGGATTTLTTTVDLLGQVVSYVDANGDTTTTSYDQAGRVTSSCTIPAGGSSCAATLSSSYDNSGRVAADDYNGAVVDTPAYDANSDLAGDNYANGTTLSYGYDAEGRLYSEVFDQAGGATLFSDSQSLSQAGDVLTDAEAGPSGSLGTDTYGYDAAGRLLSADGFGQDIAYSYTPVGGCGALSGAGANSDRTAMTETNTATGVTTDSTYCYGSDDQLSSYQTQVESGSWPLGEVTPSYDADGNTTQMATAGASSSSSPLWSSVTFPATQSWTVPAITGTLGATVSGGGGGTSGSTTVSFNSDNQPQTLPFAGVAGGAGATVQASLPATSGQALSIYVGGQGGAGVSSTGGVAGAGGTGGSGYAAGGAGGSAGTGMWTGGGGGGGGSSAIVSSGTAELEGGGGGGGVAISGYVQAEGSGYAEGWGWGGVVPGNGGDPNATGSTYTLNDETPAGPVLTTYTGGNGATTTADGQGGAQANGYAGASGGANTQSNDESIAEYGSGGGGGGGKYGGGGGQGPLTVNQGDGDEFAITNYAGGGGSSYVTPAATNVSYPAPATPANGSVTISYNSALPAVSPINNETFTYDAQHHVTSETTTAGATTTVVTYSLDALERVVQREVTVDATVTEDDLYGYANGGAAAISVTNLLGSGARAPPQPRRPPVPPARRRPPPPGPRPPPPGPPRQPRHPRPRPPRPAGAPSAPWAAWPTPTARPPRCRCRPRR